MPIYKNSFKTQVYIEQTIVDENGSIIGTIRIKPSGVLWKPTGPDSKTKFHGVSLEQFTRWITDSNTKAKRTTS